MRMVATVQYKQCKLLTKVLNEFKALSTFPTSSFPRFVLQLCHDSNLEKNTSLYSF